MFVALLTVQPTAVLTAAVAFELAVCAPAAPAINSERKTAPNNCFMFLFLLIEHSRDKGGRGTEEWNQVARASTGRMGRRSSVFVCLSGVRHNSTQEEVRKTKGCCPTRSF
jgi:hypothetical protein